MENQINIIKPKIWKQLGQTISPNATSADAMIQAGLDFEVVKLPNSHLLPSGSTTISDNSFFTCRTDTEAILGSKIGRDYEVVQNIKAFAFFDSIVGGNGGIKYETAGALGYGETIFVTAKLPDYIRVGRDDLIEQYLFLTSTHDGLSSITIAFTPVRIYCSNTLNAALNNCTNRIKIVHTASAATKLKAAHTMLGLSQELSVELEAVFNRWSRIRITDSQVKKLIQIAMVPNKETFDKIRNGNVEELSTKFNNTVDKAFEYAMSNYSQLEPTTKGTVFGAYNAVTGYLQNVYNFKDDEVKFKSLMQGIGYDRGQTAFNLCYEYTNHGISALQLN